MTPEEVLEKLRGLAADSRQDANRCSSRDRPKHEAKAEVFEELADLFEAAGREEEQGPYANPATL